ncbi:MAG: flagellar biosynthesis protein FlhA [Candidatus Abyssobacteria bacterium SURF_5]|uniref:Flagellar biosynthesis protein FlhA n=1 Tax=Abyssobacteria bacterium (strain SURF_5) TaxID=2093360 RepID=A0A3A4NSI0_ABYX5|nr:MAG: flagellar biosynthesis protein FlhA [Candidatus Abyssubacteria bacterium SURF_5]
MQTVMSSRFLRMIRNQDVVVALIIIGILFIMLVKIPAWTLDLLLTFNISISVLMILVTMYVREPLQFSVFPSLLLVTTLFRLALNVASTRLILIDAYAGRVIEAFGSFVVGGNYLVGLVIFLILVVIQFVVITRGAGRISEVAARFTLDAMPGKQMSIDADLNSGLITEDEARARRRTIEDEADFYGAMDGATKFIRGDVVAGLIITTINIVFGLIIGVMQRGFSLNEAARIYTMLTIGDGLVAQVPALFISTSAGIIITRTVSETNLGSDITRQMFTFPRAVGIAAVLLVIFAVVPGMPTFPFLFTAAAAGITWYQLNRTQVQKRLKEEREIRAREEKAAPRAPENVEGLLKIDPMEIEIGYGLIPLADPKQGGDLLTRISDIRRRTALKIGIVLPPIRIRDNMMLKPNEYAIRIRGNEITRGTLFTDHLLIMNPGNIMEKIPGIETKEPAFGLDAIWITESQRPRAEQLGYTIVDPPSVLATHLTEIINARAHELLGRQDVSNLIENAKKNSPVVVEELVPNQLTMGEIQKVLQNLLKERVPIRNLELILETLADYARRTRDPVVLTEYVRQAIARNICQEHMDDNGRIYAMTLDPRLEQKITESLKESDGITYPALDPVTAQKIISATAAESKKMANEGRQPIIVTSPKVRPYFKRLVQSSLPGLVVLSFAEIVQEIRLQAERMVKIESGA